MGGWTDGSRYHRMLIGWVSERDGCSTWDAAVCPIFYDARQGNRDVGRLIRCWKRLFLLLLKTFLCRYLSIVIPNILGEEGGPVKEDMACLSSLMTHGFSRPSGVGLMLDCSGKLISFGDTSLYFYIHDVLYIFLCFIHLPWWMFFLFHSLLHTSYGTERTVGCD